MNRLLPIIALIFLVAFISTADCPEPGWTVTPGWNCDWTVQYVPPATGLYAFELSATTSPNGQFTQCWLRYYYAAGGVNYNIHMNTLEKFYKLRLTVTPTVGPASYTEFVCPEIFADGFESGNTSAWSSTHN